MSKKLIRNTNEKILGGVCSGLADFLDLDTGWLRFGVAVSAIPFSGPVFTCYALGWLVLPDETGQRGFEALRDRLDKTNKPTGPQDNFRAD